MKHSFFILRLILCVQSRESFFIEVFCLSDCLVKLTKKSEVIARLWRLCGSLLSVLVGIRCIKFNGTMGLDLNLRENGWIEGRPYKPRLVFRHRMPSLSSPWSANAHCTSANVESFFVGMYFMLDDTLCSVDG